jgi:hypothetical protein
MATRRRRARRDPDPLGRMLARFQIDRSQYLALVHTGELGGAAIGHSRLSVSAQAPRPPPGRGMDSTRPLAGYRPSGPS